MKSPSYDHVIVKVHVKGNKHHGVADPCRRQENISKHDQGHYITDLDEVGQTGEYVEKTKLIMQ